MRNQPYASRTIGQDRPFLFAYTVHGAAQEHHRRGLSGDIVGLPDNGIFKIGDTLTEGEQALPWSAIVLASTLQVYRERRPNEEQAVQKGLEQLMNEGVLHLFVNQFSNRHIVGTMGQLQFEVIQYRLENEYNAKCRWEPVHLHKACWIEADDAQEAENFKKRKYQYAAKDIEGGRVPRRLGLCAQHGTAGLRTYQVPFHIRVLGNGEARTTQRLMPYSLVKALWQSGDKIRVIRLICAKIK